MFDMFKPQHEGLSRRARRAIRKHVEESRHPRLGRDVDPNAVNPILMANNMDADTNSGRSPAIWSTCPREQYMLDRSLGYVFAPDLYNAPVFASAVAQMGLITLQDTGVTIQGDPANVGALAWGGQDADNDAGIITGAGNVGTSFLISDSDARPLWFEIGLKKSAVTNNAIAFFAGLTEEGMATATDTLLTTDSAALKDKDFIGFHVTQAAGATVTFVYNKASAGGVTTKIASLATMTADTYIKLGFFYNPLADVSKRISIYVNNQVQSTYVTAANIAASTFPDGEELVPTIAFKKGEATIATASVRLWECAQQIGTA